MELRNNKPINQIKDLVIKEFPEKQLSAFEKADLESEIQKQIKIQKYNQLIQKEQDLNKIINKRNKQIKEAFSKEKEELKNQLINIIRNALTFSKRNNPIFSMLPEEIMSEIEKKRDLNQSSFSLLNTSNFSMMSNVKKNKYESNAFLKSLGLDLENLNANNINIQIDKAYEFVKNWKVDRNINEIIRMKVVNQIMNVKEKRALQKMEKIKEKLKQIKESKRRNDIMKKKEQEKAKKLLEDSLSPSQKAQKKMKEKLKKSQSFIQNKKFNKFKYIPKNKSAKKLGVKQNDNK